MPVNLGAAYTRHVDAVARWFRRRVGTTELAEDLTADTFVKAMQYAPTYDDTGYEGRALVFTVARSVLVDYYRREALRPNVVAGMDALALVAALIEAPVDVEIVDAIGKLTLQQRRVIRMRFLAGHTVSETALLLSSSKDNVKALQARGLLSLRRRLPAWKTPA